MMFFPDWLLIENVSKHKVKVTYSMQCMSLLECNNMPAA